MSMSVEMKAVWRKAKKYDKGLKADDKRFARTVSISLFDGAFFHFPNAFIHALHNDWVCIFTEHYDFHIFPKEDVSHYNEYQYSEEE